MIRTIRLFSLAAVILVVIGCGGPDTRGINGAVTMDGTPVSKGDIIFRSDNPEIQTVRADITDGTYAAECAIGKVKVEIMAYRETGQPDGYGGTLQEQYVPAQYNDESTLEIDVQPSGESNFDFQLTSTQ